VQEKPLAISFFPREVSPLDKQWLSGHTKVRMRFHVMEQTLLFEAQISHHKYQELQKKAGTGSDAHNQILNHNQIMES
jgi:hypothetical protein